MFNRGEYRLAKLVFEEIAATYPNDPRVVEATYWLAETHDRLNEYARSYDLYARIVREHPKFRFLSRAQYGAGYAAYQLGQFRPAIDYFQAAAQNAGEEMDILAESLLLAAECHGRLGESDRAADVLKSVTGNLKLRPEHRLDAHYDLGGILGRSGRPVEAVQALMPLTREPDHRRHVEALLEIGDILFKQKKFGESIVWYDRVIGLDTPAGNWADTAQWNKSWAFLSMGNDTRAEEEFFRLIQTPHIPVKMKAGAWLRMAAISRRAGQPDTSGGRARRALDLANRSQDTAIQDEACLFLAEGEFLLKRMDNALDHLSRVTSPTYDLHYLKGHVFLAKGSAEEAGRSFQAALESGVEPDRRNIVLLSLAQAQFQLKDYSRALESAGRITKPDPVLGAKLDEFYGNLYLATGRYQEAAGAFERLLGRPGPADAREAFYAAAFAYFRLNDHARAKSLLDRLLALPSVDTQARASGLILMGDILAAAEQPDAARQRYLQASKLAREPDLIHRAHTHLIESFLKRDPAEAVRQADALLQRLAAGQSFQFVVVSFFDAGLYDEALDRARRAGSALPGSDTSLDRILFYGMLAAYEGQRHTDARRMFQDLLQRPAVRSDAALWASDILFWQARLAQAEKDPTAARRDYLEYLNRFPSGKWRMDAHFSLGVLAFEEARWEEAESRFGSALTQARYVPGDPRKNTLYFAAIDNLVSTKVTRQDYPGARNVLLKTVESESALRDHPALLYNMGYVEMLLNRPDVAEKTLSRIFQDSAADRVILDKTVLVLSDLYYRSERSADLKRLHEKHAKAVRDPAALAHILYRVGMTWFKEEQYAQAADIFKRMPANADTELRAESALRYADCLYNRLQFDAALKFYLQAEEGFPGSAWAWEAVYAQGLCHTKLNQSDKAVDRFESYLSTTSEGLLAPNAALAAAKLYLAMDRLDDAREKLDRLDKMPNHRLARESSRLRVRIAERRGDPQEHYDQSVRHLRQYGTDPDLVLAAIQAALSIERHDLALAALDGVDPAQFSPPAADRADFYKAECLLKLGRNGAEDIYQRLIRSADTEVSLSAKYRLAGLLLDRGDTGSILPHIDEVLQKGAGLPFYEEAVIFGIAAVHRAGLHREAVRFYEAFGGRLASEPHQRKAMEVYASAALASGDKAKASGALERLLAATGVGGDKKTEARLALASLQEDLGQTGRADEMYKQIINDPAAGAAVKDQALDRRMVLADVRGERGRRFLGELLRSSLDPDRVRAASRKLVVDAVTENRHPDAVGLVRELEPHPKFFDAVVQYHGAVAKLALGDTDKAMRDFSALVQSRSPDTFFTAWASLKLGEYESAKRNYRRAEPLLRQAWDLRTNLSPDARRLLFKWLAGIYVEREDAAGLQFLSGQTPPDGSEIEHHLALGWLAHRAGNHAEAVRHLDAVAAVGMQPPVSRIYAESLIQTREIPKARLILGKLATYSGLLAVESQYRLGRLEAESDRPEKALIAYYNVLDLYPPEENRGIAPAALLGIIRIRLDLGEKDKAMAAIQEMTKRYPGSKEAAQAQKIRKSIR